MDSYQKIAQLEARYCEIIRETDLRGLYGNSQLSGVFLASPSNAYFESSKKVFIIGQETRNWRGAKCHIKNEYSSDINAIRESMQATLDFNQKKPKSSKFRQFYIKASNLLSKSNSDPKHSAVWTNQFCISYKGNSPVHSDAFPEIKELSKKLLKAQFEILSPDIAIFTVGSSRDKYIKEALDVTTIDVIHPRRLWHFKVGDTNCFRCNHPRWHGANRYLAEALELAKALT